MNFRRMIVHAGLSAALLLLPALPGFGELLVIAHPGVAESKTDAATLGSIYLGKKTSWDNGDKINAAALDGGKTHDAFLKLAVQRTPAQFSSFWKKAVFTGTGRPPKALANEAAVVEFVSSTYGAVGYIDSSTPHDKVKVLPVK